MEKVKLTKEQAEAIDKMIEFAHGNKEAIINGHKCDWEQAKFKPLNQMTVAKIAKALYIGYEVEETFEVGDWVICEDGYIGQIEYINEIEKWANIGYSKDTKERGVCLAATYDLIDIIRHATPEEIAKEKQRRWWARHGRDVWELRAGDVVMNKSTGNLFAVSERIVKEFKNEEIQDNYEVVCFAEDRKDNA